MLASQNGLPPATTAILPFFSRSSVPFATLLGDGGSSHGSLGGGGGGAGPMPSPGGLPKYRRWKSSVHIWSNREMTLLATASSVRVDGENSEYSAIPSWTVRISTASVWPATGRVA